MDRRESIKWIVATMLGVSGCREKQEAWEEELYKKTKIAFVSTRDTLAEHIHVMNADGTELKNLTKRYDLRTSNVLAYANVHPSWSPDGKKIAFAAFGLAYTLDGVVHLNRKPNVTYTHKSNSEICVMDADGSGLELLTNGYHGNIRPAWSPDGKKIAFSSNRDGFGDIYVMDVDEGNVKRLTFSKGLASNNEASWSPDGKRIAFSSEIPYSRKSYRYSGVKDWHFKHEICVMNADGSDVKRLTDGYVWNSHPAWSPDGKKIAFQSGGPLYWDIYVMDPDGSGKKKLTRRDSKEPSWSPDGRKIIFSSNREGHTTLYMMRADGSKERRLLKYSVNEDPSWSPFLVSGKK
jgi:Tol biopolymer transport system component